jgi:hypothetical protein
MRLRYQSDWEASGRREEFVDPTDFNEGGRQFWPRDVQGINPDHNPPAICLVGYWGFHSVLHSDRRDVSAHDLNRILHDLQTVMNK